VKEGGFVDFTTGIEGTEDYLSKWRNDGIDFKHVTVSSDAFGLSYVVFILSQSICTGSIPVFDEEGTLVSYEVASPNTLLSTIRRLHKEYKWPLEDILPLFTSNPSDFYHLDSGYIAEGKQADLLILDENFVVLYTIAKGKILVRPTE